MPAKKKTPKKKQPAAPKPKSAGNGIGGKKKQYKKRMH